MPKMYVLVVNKMEKEIIERAVKFCCDYDTCGGELPDSMVEDLKKTMKKWKEGGEYVANGL